MRQWFCGGLCAVPAAHSAQAEQSLGVLLLTRPSQQPFEAGLAATHFADEEETEAKTGIITCPKHVTSKSGFRIGSRLVSKICISPSWLHALKPLTLRLRPAKEEPGRSVEE